MTLFAEVAVLAESLAAEGSRLKKRAAIAEVVGRVDVSDVGLMVLYLAGQPFAEADARKLNAGGALLSRAVKDVSEANDAALTAAYRRHGDLGAAAAHDLLAAHRMASATDGFRRRSRWKHVAGAFDDDGCVPGPRRRGLRRWKACCGALRRSMRSIC